MPQSDEPTRPLSHSARQRESEHWKRNVRYVSVLLALWFAISFLCGIVFVEPLDAFTVPGTRAPLGFWIAQQGSIYVFVILIFVYVALMNRLDTELGMGEDEAP